MKVARWGKSLAVRLPAEVVRELDLKEGDDVTIDFIGARRLEIPSESEINVLLVRLRDLRGRIPADFRFDRLEASAR